VHINILYRIENVSNNVKCNNYKLDKLPRFASIAGVDSLPTVFVLLVFCFWSRNLVEGLKLLFLDCDACSDGN